MIIAFAPPSIIALQAPTTAPTVHFAAPPESALTGTGLAPAPKILVSAVSKSAPIASAVAPQAVQPKTVSPAMDAALSAPVSSAQALPTPAGISPVALLKTTLAATSPLVVASAPAIEPAAGLWVLATARCPLPTGTDLNGWAECTQPLGFNGGELAVLEKPKAGNKAQLTGGLFSIARTRYRTAALSAAHGAAPPSSTGPAVVQVEVPGLTGRSYVYVAIRPELTDNQGRFVSARAWPVACPPPGSPEVTRRGDRCVASSLKAVADAASVVPAEGGYVLRWIDATDAGSAGDTGGSRRYAPPPPPVYKAPRKLSPLEAAEPLPISDLPPELAAQQPQALEFGPRDDDDDASPAVRPDHKSSPSRNSVKGKKKS